MLHRAPTELSPPSLPDADITLPTTLDAVKIQALPPSAYYISNFISESEEQHILEKIASAPKPRWKQLSHRRLQTWPSALVNNTLVEAPFPPWLETPIIPRLLSIPLSGSENNNIFAHSPHGRPNHVLINEYPPGVGIMPHKDGSAYHEIVCTISLGASLCLNYHQCKEDGALDPNSLWRVVQEPRSLLITTVELYTTYLHGIPDVELDVNLDEDTVANWNLLRSHSPFANGLNVRRMRTSLTYRDVIRVSKLGDILGALLKR